MSDREIPCADELSEKISKEALTLPSALTEGYQATLDAAQLLRHDHPRKAADRLRDAAILEDREIFDELASQVDELING